MAEEPNMISGVYTYTFDMFTVFFHGDYIYVGGKEFPTGQLTVDMVNREDAVLDELEEKIAALIPAVQRMLDEKTDSTISSAQEKLNAVWDVIFTLPPYRDLNMNEELAYNLFFRLHSDREKWEQVLTPNSSGWDNFQRMMAQLIGYPNQLRAFQAQIRLMAGHYFESLKRRNATAYAEAYSAFYANMIAVAASCGEDFLQSYPMEVDFVPMLTPDGDGMFLAEKATFGDPLHFLRTEFYRGLILGNAPRRCHNCGRYFLLTEGYNTCYCNNIAPGETERTCRKVGAHRKEAHGKANRTPAQKDYVRTYNRLKQRKNRGKISIDEWNKTVAYALELVMRNEEGKLSDEELKTLLDTL